MTLGARMEGENTFVFCINYTCIAKNGQFIPQELFPFVFLAPRVLNLSCQHYYLSENI